MMMLNHTKRLGELLVDRGLVEPDDLDHALTEQKRGSGERLGEVLLKMGVVSQENLFHTLAEQLGIPFMPLMGATLDRRAIEKVPARLVNLYDIIPVAID